MTRTRQLALAFLREANDALDRGEYMEAITHQLWATGFLEIDERESRAKKRRRKAK